VTRALRAILLAVLFLGSGLLTFQIYYWVAKSGSEDTQMLRQLLTGLPFGAVCSLRFLRDRKWIVPAMLLDCVAWIVAFRLGLALSGNVNTYVGMAVAGAVGASLVALATGQRRAIGGATLTGAFAGMLFGLALTHPQHEILVLAFCFPLWQVAVGLWIWFSCTRPTAA
jgi:hypothetical protein